MAKDAESETTSYIAVLPTHAYYLTFVAVDHTWSELTWSDTHVSIRLPGTEFLHIKRREDIVLPPVSPSFYYPFVRSSWLTVYRHPLSKGTWDHAKNVEWIINSAPFHESECPLAHGN